MVQGTCVKLLTTGLLSVYRYMTQHISATTHAISCKICSYSNINHYYGHRFILGLLYSTGQKFGIIRVLKEVFCG